MAREGDEGSGKSCGFCQPEVSYLLSEDSVSVTFRLGDKPFRTKAVRRGTLEYERALEAIRAGDMKALVDAMAASEQAIIENFDRFPDKDIELRDSTVYIDGEPVPADLSKRMVGWAQHRNAASAFRHAAQRLPWAQHRNAASAFRHRSLVNFWRVGWIGQEAA